MKKLGLPKNWAGKPPTVAAPVSSPGESDVWFYYGDAAGVRFDDSGHAAEITLHPSRINSKLRIFRSWPIGPGATMSDFRRFLVENSIPFVESDDPPEMYYILADEHCVAFGPPYRNRKLVPKGDREIAVIGTVATKAELPEFVHRWPVKGAGRL